MDFDVLTDHRVKMKERENIDEYLDLARELKKKKKKKKRWHRKVTIIPIIIGVLRTIPSGLKKSDRIGNQRYNRDHSFVNIR